MPSTSWSGRPPVRRCALVAVLLGALAVPAAHADGDPPASRMPTCPTDGSVTVFDDSIHEQRTRIALYSPATGETDLCFQTMNSVQFVLGVFTSTAGVMPGTSVVVGSGGCAGQIVRTGSPVDMEIGFDPATGSVCYGNDGATTTVTVTPAPGGPVPHLSLWLPANSALNEWGWCTTHWLKWKSGFHAAKAAWKACYQQDNQVL